jgi:hypothetical protein
MADTKVTTVQVADASGPGSPFAISGSVEVSEIFLGSGARISFSEDIVGRNIADRTILAVVAWLDIAPSRTPPHRFTRQYE